MRWYLKHLAIEYRDFFEGMPDALRVELRNFARFAEGVFGIVIITPVVAIFVLPFMPFVRLRRGEIPARGRPYKFDQEMLHTLAEMPQPPEDDDA